MTNPAGFDFTKFVPGFDFLKNLTPGGASAATSAATGWVAPTLDPEELDKRIQELKTVQFWLEQNSKAVGATIQALEVQRMTLQTLKGMNMSFNDLADSLKVSTQDAAQAASKFSFTTEAPEQESAKPQAAAPKPKARKPRAQKASTGVDPSHWWNALTDQFQHIATHAMKDMTERANTHGHAHAHTHTHDSDAYAGATPGTKKTAAKKPASKVTAKTTTRKTTARKTTTKSRR